MPDTLAVIIIILEGKMKLKKLFNFFVCVTVTAAVLIQSGCASLNFRHEYDRGMRLYNEKKYDEALKIVDEILKNNENYIAAYIIGAQAAYENGDLEKTKDFAQSAISLDINYGAGYYYLSLVRFAQKDYEEAVECMKRAIMYDVNNARYYADMSKIYKEAGDIKTAMEYIKEAESIDSSTEYKILYTELAALNRKSKKN